VRGGSNLWVVGISCADARRHVFGFASHPGEYVESVNGFGCYPRPVPLVGIRVVCIDSSHAKAFRFDFS
jgi:hypothetical protein